MAELRLVEQIPCIEPAHIHNVALALLGFAGAVDDGSIPAAKAIVITVDDDGVPELAAFGQPMNTAEILGTLELAKVALIEEEF